jgi:hypothetical protein
MKINKYRSILINDKNTYLGSFDYGDVYISSKSSQEANSNVISRYIVSDEPIASTGSLGDIENMVNVSNGINFISSNGVLYALLEDDIVASLEKQYGPDVSLGNLIEVLDLGADETITDLIKIEENNSVLLSTSTGRIISCGKDVINAYMTGNTSVYATAKNGFGLESNTVSTSITYALYNKIAQVNEEKEIEKWKFEFNSSAITTEKVNGMFISPVIYIEEEIGRWSQIIWEEVKPNDSTIVISLKSADSLVELLNKKWQNYFSSSVGESSPITRNLNNTLIQGKYVQMKVEMTANVKDITPLIAKITLKYSTKQASYFFTTKFSLTEGNIERGIIVASITEPKNTEITFGIVSNDSVEWKDYKKIETDDFFELNGIENVKIGIRFVSYDTSIPEVAEFAFMAGGEVVEKLNT